MYKIKKLRAAGREHKNLQLFHFLRNDIFIV